MQYVYQRFDYVGFIQDLIKFNETKTKRIIEQYPNKEQALIECAIKFSLGRQSGHTTAAMDFVNTPKFLVLTYATMAIFEQQKRHSTFRGCVQYRNEISPNHLNYLGCNDGTQDVRKYDFTKIHDVRGGKFVAGMTPVDYLVIDMNGAEFGLKARDCVYHYLHRHNSLFHHHQIKQVVILS